ncbi:MAG TPA: Asp-tRNA(Asn)/Glu-tRNA(Gln) amidotransferase subunit GatA [Candidatus Babeliales bacterium]|nr:Asp-tRNA(Asn)/Glu-tRNA(Gln) amidotransferase subunit GatA [Candidatus Babeliales bacterium]
MKSFAFATIDQLKAALDKKEISSEELLVFYLKRFEKYDTVLGSALEIFDIDSILENSSTTGSLAQIPGIIKDNICQKGRIASCASKYLEHVKAPYDATAILRLKSAGALLIGRANCDEFAMGCSGENSAYKDTANPWDLSRVSGGSSSGSIAAVAAGLVPWSLGSETGGSVRLPAAFCGITGLKPTYGLISRKGLVAYASSLDQIGIATRTIKDNAQVLSVIAGYDENDFSCAQIPPKDYAQNIDSFDIRGKTIGIIETMFNAEGLDSEIRLALEGVIAQYEKLGVKTKKIQVPSLEYGAAVYFIISRAEAASNLARFDGVRYGHRISSESLFEMYCKTRHDGFGAEVRKRIIVGNYVLSAGHAGRFYQKARQVQAMIQEDLARALFDVDVLLSPVHSIPAFKFGAFDENILQMDLQDYFTGFCNLAGVPALAVPCGFTNEKLPIGFQLIGKHFTEELLYQMAYAYERETTWHTQTPPDFE